MMNHKTIYTKVTALINRLLGYPINLTQHSNLNYLRFSKYQYQNLVMSINDTFKLSITTQEIEHLNTINSIVKLIERKFESNQKLSDHPMRKTARKLKRSGSTGLSGFGAHFKLDSPKKKSITVKGGKVSLFYATNRIKQKSNKVNQFYGSKKGKLRFGSCSVNIPPDHRHGMIERPRSILFFEFKENAKKHIVLEKVREQNEKDFYENLKESLSKSPDRSAFIFIHGYNTTFADAARRTAQIAWDLRLESRAGFFSWPSQGKKISYPMDGELAEASIPDLQRFIKEFIKKTKVKNLHLIAHSMGSKILVRALNNIVGEKNTKISNVIQQVVLGAADIDQDTFKSTLLPSLKNIGLRRTIYSSDKDKALKLSQKLRQGLSRLGEGGQSVFVSPYVETIDASNVKSNGNGHGYIFDTRELLSDLFLLLNQNLSPKQRSLHERKKDNLTYWHFPL